MYVASFPVFSKIKQHKDREYQWSKYTKQYGYLSLNKSNKLNLIFKLSNTKESMIITVPKHYLYDTLLLNLMWRPISRPRTVDNNLWLHPSARKLSTQRKFNDMPPDILYGVFENCLETMDDLVLNLTGDQQEKAKKQFDSLQAQQWKAQLLNEMWISKNFEKIYEII